MTLQIRCPHLALFHAKRNSGKSRLMVHILGILARGHSFQWVEVVSATSFNGEYQAFVGEDHVRAELDPQWLDALLRRQATLKQNGVLNPGLIILDDCLGACNFQSKLFTRIAAAGRHYGVTVWASFQHMGKTPAVLRSNADYVFCLNVQNERVSKALYEEYGPPGFSDWRALRDFAAKACLNFGCLVVDNTKGGKIMVVRAPKEKESFRIAQ